MRIVAVLCAALAVSLSLARPPVKGGAKEASCEAIKRVSPTTVCSGDGAASRQVLLATEEGEEVDAPRMTRWGDRKRTGRNPDKRIPEAEQVSASASPEPIPEKYIWFSDIFGSLCIDTLTYKNQGDCNSCWAYSLALVAQYKFCRQSVSMGATYSGTSLSPYPLICGVDYGEAVTQDSMCQARSMVDAFNWLQANSLPRRRFSFDLGGPFASDNPNPDDCAKVLEENKHDLYGPVTANKMFAVLGERRMKRTIMDSGPIIVIIRLTEDFVNFTGELFKGVEKPVFYQQDGTPFVGANQPEDDWNNHFMVALGWGVEPTGEKYWLVENSWGLIYEFKNTIFVGHNDRKAHSFFKIDHAVAGPGYLEMYNRYAYDLKEVHHVIQNESKYDPLNREDHRGTG